jgi:hypothetical protein
MRVIARPLAGTVVGSLPGGALTPCTRVLLKSAA